MNNVVLNRRQLLKGAGAVGVLGALGIPTTVFAEGTRIRWDLPNIDFSTLTLMAGGFASARANDSSKITLTGSGTFRPGEGEGATGGGDWHTFSSAGAATGSGTYKVRELVSWELAPGTAPLPHDAIGKLADERAGLVVLRIRYSDGSRGVLTVSCHLVKTPDAVFEGITATKSFVDYWNREAPTNGVNGDRTIFHVMPEE